MKPLFGTDLTTNKKNDTANIERFACERISQASSDALDDVSEQATDVAKKASLPVILKIIFYACGFGLLVMLRVLRELRIDSDTTIQQVLKDNPWTIIVVMGLGAVIWIIGFYSKRLNKKVTDSEEYAVTESRINNVLANVYAELGVPSEAEDVDVFFCFYKEKNGKYIVKRSGVNPFDFVNFSNKIFIENGNLYVADTTTKYCIPDFIPTSIEKVNKRKTFPIWNKDTPHNKGEYKQYKISYNDSVYSCKPFYILHFESYGEKWGLYFPSYELPFFEKLTGLKG